MDDNQAQAILDFWFSEPMVKHWFSSTPEIDTEIRQKYDALWKSAASGALDHWKQQPLSCLALILLLDQFPLNMYRGQAQSFETEVKASEMTLFGIKQGHDKSLKESQLAFFYMPLMHSEQLELQHLSVEKFQQAGLTSNERFARHHRDIIIQFGRFPHRNESLGRPSTPEELAYLESDKAFKG